MDFSYFTDIGIWSIPFVLLKDPTPISALFIPVGLIWVLTVLMLIKESKMDSFYILVVSTNPFSLITYVVFVASPLTFVSILVFCLMALKLVEFLILKLRK